VAEDLGIITDSVRRLMQDVGLPGMKVLQFAFEGATEYLPHSTIPYSVLYPGTHDNDTSWGWFGGQPDHEAERGDSKLFRFPAPLIEPDVRIARIRLSDRIHGPAVGRAPRCTRRICSTPSGPKITSFASTRVPREGSWRRRLRK
jgi:hypothetical protein